ncbi:radical SAM family heme chaperone HemW [Asticcacaulis solisilvae]|uniref:radical SAM family heme chaperone HemW n=1 Tax=Asticcacaulis solisilvae TaxID=1217274 RepID=UPI003FD76AB5
MTEPVSLYVHWPYCARICPYCDFNVTRDRGQAIQRTLFDAILTDLRTQAEAIGPRRLASVFFGGGTPSLLPPEWVADLVAEARRLFPAAEPIEITLEANPTDAEIGRYRAFHQTGINRLSLGVQSLDDDALKFLGRNHSAAEARRGIETAQGAFGRVSLDLIYALPGQSAEAWRKALTDAAALGVEHISPYQLTIESGTAFGRAVRRKLWAPPDEETAEAFYFATQDTLERSGFEAYEVSNHARGPAARSQHNVLIWEGVDYIGVGPGAHGRLTKAGIRHATTALSDLKTYIARVNETGTGHDSEALNAIEAQEEAAMLGLRLIEGLDLARTPDLGLGTRAAPLIADGFMAIDGNRLRATAKGRVVLDRLLFELLS